MFSVSFIPEDEFSQWSKLWEKYLLFYETSIDSSVTENTWKKLMQIDNEMFSYGVYWKKDNYKVLVGFTNFLYHASTWTKQGYCYLEDLYVEEDFRGKGLGRLLITSVWKHCQSSGVERLYWKTEEKNKLARVLYDRVANSSGFIEYEKNY